jgi:cytochrome c5
MTAASHDPHHHAPSAPTAHAAAQPGAPAVAPHDSHDAHDEGHTGPIKTPKQLAWAVLASFIIPILGAMMLANFVSTGTRPGAGSTVGDAKAVAARLKPVGFSEVKDVNDPAAMKTGVQVYSAQCAACHTAGVANSPKLGDVAAWAPRLKTGYDTLVTSALKGKGAMGAQGGGDYSDFEIARAVVHMTNAAGGTFAEPTFAAPAAKP